MMIETKEKKEKNLNSIGLIPNENEIANTIERTWVTIELSNNEKLWISPTSTKERDPYFCKCISAPTHKIAQLLMKLSRLRKKEKYIYICIHAMYIFEGKKKENKATSRKKNK